MNVIVTKGDYSFKNFIKINRSVAGEMIAVIPFDGAVTAQYSV